MADFDVTITSNRKLIEQATTEQIARALEAIGLQAEGYAKMLCPVDTGNLRNSITHTVDADEQKAYVGTNVEYAPYVELGSRGRKGKHMLQRAATEHSDEYKLLMEDSMKNA